MFRIALVFMILAACGLANQSGAATLEGTVSLTAPNGPGISSGKYQVKTGAVVANPEPALAVVYLEGAAKPASSSEPARPIELSQKDYQFSRSVLPVQVGARVSFPNLDDDYHNVFSYSKPKRFDLGRYRKDEEAASVVFDKPGVVKLFCEIHEHMRATILVLDTPYFTRTDASGAFKLENLPAGKFTLKVWLDEKRILEKAVELVEGQTLKVDFN